MYVIIQIENCASDCANLIRYEMHYAFYIKNYIKVKERKEKR